MDVSTQRCGSCSREKSRDKGNFKPIFGRTGIEYNKTCRGCVEHVSRANKKKREEKKAQKENLASDGPPIVSQSASNEDDPEDASEFLGLTEVPLDGFLDELSRHETLLSVSGFVSLASLEGDTTEHVKTLVQHIWDRLQYRFMYVYYSRLCDDA